MIKIKKYGDWSRAGKALRLLSTNILPAFKAQIDEDGRLVLDTMIEHIERQDLNWIPLSPHTVALKGGSETIYVETGYLKENLEVRRIKSSKDSYSIFVGASPWKKHKPSGKKFSDLMIWLEYGTDKMPPRPLIRPTWEEVSPIIEKNWSSLLSSLVKEVK